MGKAREILRLKGYEPFGSLLPGRNYSSSNNRFGFQGQEKDDEIYGATGTSYAFEYRIHDPRVGRFLSIDPLAAKYAYNSPYAFSENRVIDGIEFEGLEVVPLNDGGTVEGPYANSDQALGAALDEKGSDGAGTKSINLPDLVINGRNGSASENGGSATNLQSGPSPFPASESGDNTGFNLAATGVALEGIKSAVGPTTFRLANMGGTNFSPKLYPSGWAGGSAGKISTYGLGKVVGFAGKGVGVFGMGLSLNDMIKGDVSPGRGIADLIMGGVGTFGGNVGAIWGLSYEAGKRVGPSTWYGSDDASWFK